MQNFFLEKFKIRNVKVYLYVQIIGYKSTFHMITSQHRPMKGIHNAYDHMVRSAGLNGQWKTSNFSFFWKENAHTEVLLFFRQKMISSPSISSRFDSQVCFPKLRLPANSHLGGAPFIKTRNTHRRRTAADCNYSKQKSILFGQKSCANNSFDIDFTPCAFA